MSDAATLRCILRRIDRRGYKAYRDIEGVYAVGDFTLFIDRVQSDPFAPPSKIRLRVSKEKARLPEDLMRKGVRRMALSDFIARKVREGIGRLPGARRGSGKSGKLFIDAGGQEVLERTAVVLTEEWVEARMEVGLPAAGRTILADEAEELLLKDLIEAGRYGLMFDSAREREARNFVYCVENQEFIRSKLPERHLVAFVADGSILPRKSGASDLPMDRERAVPFMSPPELRVEFELPNPISSEGEPRNRITGMGLPEGVTLIVGGGFHGKSTLLKAIERGVYPHIPGDGREYVVTCPHAVKIRAEDGRRVEKVDISPFIGRLPGGISTVEFSTDDASGSTSQAANIMEALEVGARVFLLDEDTSATNFMIRDARMQALVSKKDEPITPFIDRVRELYEEFGVSSVIVMGGSGDYFDVADTVLMMREYVPLDVTKKAKEIAASIVTKRKIERTEPMGPPAPRIPLPESVRASRGKREVKIDVKAVDLIRFGYETIDLRHVEQLVDMSQTRAVAYSLYLASHRFMDGRRALSEILDLLERAFDEEGLDILDPFHRPGRHPGNFARPRRHEIAAALNRLRTLAVKRK